MDPEQIYQEVLKEEQGKGVSAPVAEGRAKAARVRAEHGSPHPKEAKWWPGSQPHFEGGEAAAASEEAVEEVAEEEAPEEPVVEAPEAPAAEAPAAEPEPAPVAEAPTPAQQTEAPAPAPEAPAPAQQPAAVATAPPPPPGVSHGTATGSRMRPEDGVATQAMLDGQQAMYQRRKLIDELVTTGAPAVTAEEAGRPKAPMLALLYILIPLIAVIIVVAQDEESSEPAGGAGAPVEETGGGEGGGGGLTVTAKNIAFDKAELTFPAGEATELTFTNEDAGTDHNVAIYPDQGAGIEMADPLFQGAIFPGVETVTYEVPALEAGEYFFQCDVHKNMNGTATVQ